MASVPAQHSANVTSLYYISPSVLPSRTANSAHVVLQCNGFAAAGADVTLVAKRSVDRADALPAAVESAYGVPAGSFRFDTVSNRWSRGDNLRIAAHALSRLRTASPVPDVVLSRNLYAAYVLGAVQRRDIIFETHQIETGLRGYLQRALLTRPNVLTVVISQKLREILTGHHGVAPRRVLVLHDAAPDGIRPIQAGEKRPVLQSLVTGVDVRSYRTVCGYFGHLYPGRGMEVIEAMAQARPDTGFLIFGGNESDLIARRQANTQDNLHYAGFVPHATAQRAMAACDVLLMPYQHSVSIGVKGHDTARWMSPMKMFEYLASGTPIISSDLPALREVLDDGNNALLASPGEPEEWLRCLDRLVDNEEVARAIGTTAHETYARDHTWSSRARKILAAARCP